jgi:GTP-binding protein
MASRFIDKIRLEVRAGKGGNGSLTYTAHKLKKLLGPGMPCGGNGGRGGDVRITAATGARSLGSIQPVIQAGNGGNGKRDRVNGSPGTDSIIRVPIGVSIMEPATRRLIADLVSPDQSVVVAVGGAGGKGNNNARPHEATMGEPGSTCRLVLELKTIAEVALVGFPNAGKSSLLQFVSNATPKIASYPFTTLSPHIGTVGKGVKIADIPGLVEEAHLNRGMGHEFLRHVERTGALLFVLDSSCQHWNPNETEKMGEMKNVLEILRNEIQLYESSMSQKPWGVVVNKIDPESGDDLAQRLESANRLESELRSSEPAFRGLVAISAKYSIGRQSLLDLIDRLMK